MIQPPRREMNFRFGLPNTDCLFKIGCTAVYDRAAKSQSLVLGHHCSSNQITMDSHTEPLTSTDRASDEAAAVISKAEHGTDFEIVCPIRRIPSVELCLSGGKISIAEPNGHIIRHGHLRSKDGLIG